MKRSQNQMVELVHVRKRRQHRLLLHLHFVLSHTLLQHLDWRHTCEAEFYFTFVFLVFFGSIIDPETYLFFVRSSEKRELFSRDCFTETQMKLSRVPKSDVGVISHHCCAGSSPLAYEQGPEHLQRLYVTCTLRNYKSRSASQAAFSNSRAKEN